MKSFSLKNKILTVILGLTSSLVLFQNCSRATFSQAPVSEKIDVVSTGETDPSVPACKNDEQLIHGSCVVFQCKSYQELKLAADGSLVVPRRDASTGICYFTKVLNGNLINGQVVPVSTRVSENILSRDHDSWVGNIKPKNLGYKKILITLSDKRALKLVGEQKREDSKLLVDNYFLIRMNNESSLKAYGTRDASYIDSAVNVKFSDYILYNNKKVSLKSFIDGGTALVDPIDITEQIKVGQQTDLHIHGLDCGAGQELHEVYLLLQ